MYLLLDECCGKALGRFALAGTSASHPGVLLIPSLPNAELRPHFEKLLKVAEPLLAATPGLCVEVDTHGVVTSFTVP
jgi:hypothetical protein